MKGRRKWLSIISAVALAVSCFMAGNTVMAMDAEDIAQNQNLQKGAKDVDKLMQDIQGNWTNASVTNSNVPIFLVYITDGENYDFTNAFYVRDSLGNGSTYLVTSGLVDAYLDEGLEVYVLNENSCIEITESYTDSTGVFSYLVADELQNMEPLELTDDFINSDSSIVSVIIEDNNYDLQAIEIDIEDWVGQDGLYFDGDTIDNRLNVGSPVIDMDTMQVWGMQQVSTDDLRVICDLNQFPFNEAAAIVEGNESQPAASDEGTSEESQDEDEPVDSQEEAPVSEPQEETSQAQNQGSSNDKTKLLIVVVIVAAAIYFVKKKKGGNAQTPNAEHKNGNARTPHEEYKEGTVLLHTEKEPIQSEDTDKPVKESVEKKMRIQLRGMSGEFAGQVFEVKGSLVIGRSRECQIIYPPKTAGVSGKHCVVMAKEEGIIIRDLQSTYGTFVGTTKLQPQLEYYLNEGMEFYLGEAKQCFRVEKITS